jgi:hypothetical protein
MASYRFCRPDDIPYLARALNECYDIHFPGDPPMTVKRFREEMKTLSVWPSNAMVASTNAGPVAVMIGTKRGSEVLVLRIGVLPEHQRQEHGLHMLTSLSQKLAVLGPERLIVEVPRALPGLRQFVTAASYHLEATYTDYLRPVVPVEPVPEEWMISVGVEEMVENGLLSSARRVAWERSVETLLNRKEELQGLVLASPERIEAGLVYDPSEDAATTDVLAIGDHGGARRAVFLELLLRSLISRTDRPLRLPKLAVGEVPEEVLKSLGFEPGPQFDRYSAVATAA